MSAIDKGLVRLFGKSGSDTLYSEPFLAWAEDEMGVTPATLGELMVQATYPVWPADSDDDRYRWLRERNEQTAARSQIRDLLRGYEAALSENTSQAVAR